MHLVERIVGSRDIFSIEFSVQPDLTRPANEWWGTLRLWAEGRCVGNPDEIEMVSIGFGDLVNAAHQTGSRVNLFLSSQTAGDALEYVLQTIYGDEKAELLTDKEASKFEVFPASAGPFFDDWQAILLEEGQTERFIYRSKGGPACEARWPIGTLKGIVLLADVELKRIWQATPEIVQ
jgi:hypothetical protein